MENLNEFKKVNYGKNICALTEEGFVLFNPDSKNEVAGADKMTYDEYLDVQINSFGKTRGYFANCYFNYTMGFMGQIEKTTPKTVCFKRIFVSGMYSDGTMFDGKEDHVWMDKNGFETLSVGDCVSFFADVYRYVKTRNGKQIDFSLRNPKEIKQIESYELPNDKDLILQDINEIICETCFITEQCNRNMCMMNPKRKKLMKKKMYNMIESVKGE